MVASSTVPSGEDEDGKWIWQWRFVPVLAFVERFVASGVFVTDVLHKFDSPWRDFQIDYIFWDADPSWFGASSYHNHRNFVSQFVG